MHLVKVAALLFFSLNALFATIANAQSAKEYYFQRAEQAAGEQCEKDRQQTHAILNRHFRRVGVTKAEIQDRTYYCRDGNYKVMYVILGNGQGCTASVSLRQNRVVYSDCN